MIIFCVFTTVHDTQILHVLAFSLVTAIPWNRVHLTRQVKRVLRLIIDLHLPARHFLIPACFQLTQPVAHRCFGSPSELLSESVISLLQNSFSLVHLLHVLSLTIQQLLHAVHKALRRVESILRRGLLQDRSVARRCILLGKSLVSGAATIDGSQVAEL